MPSFLSLRRLLAGCVASLAAPVGAVSFNIGPLEGQLDSTLSLETGWSTAKADKDREMVRGIPKILARAGYAVEKTG